VTDGRALLDRDVDSLISGTNWTEGLRPSLAPSMARVGLRHGGMKEGMDVEEALSSGCSGMERSGKRREVCGCSEGVLFAGTEVERGEGVEAMATSGRVMEDGGAQ